MANLTIEGIEPATAVKPGEIVVISVCGTGLPATITAEGFTDVTPWWRRLLNRFAKTQHVLLLRN